MTTNDMCKGKKPLCRQYVCIIIIFRGHARWWVIFLLCASMEPKPTSHVHSDHRIQPTLRLDSHVCSIHLQSSLKLLVIIRMIIIIKDGTPLIELHSKAPFIEGTGLGMVLAPFGIVRHGNAKTDRLVLLVFIQRSI